jgi:dihydrofolate reductase
MTKVHAIMACTDDHVVGIDDYIPWKMGADMKRFKEITSGHALLIGFRTFAGIVKHYPRPTIFPNRDVYVMADFSRNQPPRPAGHYLSNFNPEHEMKFLAEMEELSKSANINFSNVKFINTQTFHEYIHAYSGSPVHYTKLMLEKHIKLRDDQILYVAGGPSIYSAFLHVVDTIELTVVETKLKKEPKGAFNYDLCNHKLVEIGDYFKQEVFGFNSSFKRQLIGKISKDEKNEYNASYYQLTRSLDGSTPAQVFQGTRT